MPVGAAPAVRVNLLGGFSLRAGSASVRLESVKSEALLAFLALEPGPHARPKMAGLLWPETAETRAARNLRHALWDLRRAFGDAAPDAIVGSRTQAAFVPGDRVQVDAATLMAAGREAGAKEDDLLRELEAAAELYRGDLLDGVLLADAEEFESWLVVQRERLRAQACDVLRRLVQIHRRRGDAGAALAHARRLVALDPWREEAHRAVMELLALLGEPAAALAQFETCRQVLAEQLQTAPTADTVRLAERIRSLPWAAEAPVTSLPLLRHNLPVPSTPFVGREEELEAIGLLLAKPECRVLCLLGPGGIGKTRLALRVAHRLVLGGESAAAFPDGIWFVPAQETPGENTLLPAIAAAAGLHAVRDGADGEIASSLFAHLRSRRVLLLVDGFEHVLGETGAASALMAAAPEVKLLLTTRERPRLDGEWVFEVRGLPMPAGAGGDRTGAATRLFVETARRVRFGFKAGAEDHARIEEICRAVDGSPLAIELAAGWVRSLPVAEIARGLVRSDGLLASAEDQRLRAVFERSYARLSADERRALRALSALAGGISREAALAVAAADPSMLRALVDRSFLRLDAGSGRYVLHEVLRFFAGQRLAAKPAERAQVLALHAEFFAGLLEAREEAICGRGDHDAIAAVAVDIDNLRAAWQWVLAHEDAALIRRCLPTLAALHDTLGWYREGERLLGQAVDTLTMLGRAVEAGVVADGLLARTLVARAALRNRLGMYDPAVADLERGLTGLDGERDGAVRAAALVHLGDAALLQGRFAEAHRHLTVAIELARRCGAEPVLAEALGRLGRVVLDQGRHAQARALFQESLTAARALANQPAMIYATNQLGFVAYFDGALDEAERLFGDALDLAHATADRAAAALALQGLGFVAEDRDRLDLAAEFYGQGLAICEEHGDRFGAGRNLMLLGEIARKRRLFEDALRYYDRSLEINRAIGSSYTCGLLHGNLALAAAAARDLAGARAEVREAFREYRSTGSFNVVLEPLIALADVAHAEGDCERALALLGLVQSHPGNRQDHRIEAERVLAAIRRDRPGLDVDRLLARGATLDLETEVDTCLGTGSAG
ncbi:MAG: tetratricopeptide repeat protein [Thermoanaerobaculaceae bacterium]|nr:tetratricopeptide repeat protein [Thermoanaerobaculaceae bacterium]